MRKKLRVTSEKIRNLTPVERAAILGGAPTQGAACDPFPDIPPRLGPTKYAQHCITASCPDQT